LKPANLIRQQQDGKLVLIDFGAVKQMQNDPLGPAPINPTTIAVGTEGYMPTEQVRGKPRPNSDIYALGIIGIQAITGINPGNLQEDRDGEVIWRSYVPDIDEDLAAILTKMVRYHFKDRYQTATEVLQEIQPLHDHYCGRSTTASAASRIQPPIGSNAVDQPETKFAFHQDSQQNDQSDKVLDGNQRKKLSIEQALRWFALSRIRSIAVLGLVLGAIAIPTGIWFLRPKSATNSATPKPEQTGQVSATGEQAPANSNRLKGDYRRLQSYLQKKDWENADEETYQMMLKIAGPISEQQGRFSDQEWKEFSCSDLKEIDRLWSDASIGKLGFSAQNRVLNSAQNRVLSKEEKAMAFLKEVRWVDENLSWIVEPIYDPQQKRVEYAPGKAPDFTRAASIEGYLPAKFSWDGEDSRFLRFEDCGL
jgi:serine/threonine protein kinase